MYKIITFTGAQGTGKTTIKKALVEHLEGHGHKVMSNYVGVTNSIARDAKKLGFTINEETNFQSQYYIAARFIVSDLETRLKASALGCDFIVLDRSPLDVIPYSNLAKSIGAIHKTLIEIMLYQHFSLYSSALVYCEPLSFLEKDSDRSGDLGFQSKVVEEFEKMLINANLIGTSIRLGETSVENRLQILLKKLGL